MNRRVLTSILALGLTMSSPAMAADKGGLKDVPARTIFDDYTKPDPTFKPSVSLYVGALGGYGTQKIDLQNFENKDGAPEFGAYAGLMVNWTKYFSSGIEADYMRTSLKFEPNCPLDKALKSDYLASVRGVAGYNVNSFLMVYGTAGVGWADIGDPGLVYGGGLQVKWTDHVLVKVEALRFDLNGEAKGRDVGRFGIAYQF